MYEYALFTEAKRDPSLVSCLVVKISYYITTTIDPRLRARLEVCNKWSVGVLSYGKDYFSGLFLSKKSR